VCFKVDDRLINLHKKVKTHHTHNLKKVHTANSFEPRLVRMCQLSIIFNVQHKEQRVSQELKYITQLVGGEKHACVRVQLVTIYHTIYHRVI
jgi:hypothetical protein